MLQPQISPRHWLSTDATSPSLSLSSVDLYYCIYSISVLASSHLGGQGVLVLVVDSNRATQQVDAVEVVNGEDGALLVLVLDEAEALQHQMPCVEDTT